MMWLAYVVGFIIYCVAGIFVVGAYVNFSTSELANWLNKGEDDVAMFFVPVLLWPLLFIRLFVRGMFSVKGLIPTTGKFLYKLVVLK